MTAPIITCIDFQELERLCFFTVLDVKEAFCLIFEIFFKYQRVTCHFHLCVKFTKKKQPLLY